MLSKAAIGRSSQLPLGLKGLSTVFADALFKQAPPTETNLQAPEPGESSSHPGPDSSSAESSGTPDCGGFQIARFSLLASPARGPRHSPSREVYVTIDSQSVDGEMPEPRAAREPAREQCNDDRARRRNNQPINSAPVSPVQPVNSMPVPLVQPSAQRP